MSHQSAPVVIERTGLYRVTSFGNGAAYSFERLAVKPAEVFIQGDAAIEWRAAYDDVASAYATPGTIFHRQSWDQCLSYLWDLVSEE